ncbi:MAG TPA: hypothetical protein VE338_22210 [Ktedonobacterales bacterium]|jgi:hypothetical protein|nr:hypothetical protein [Ktedonobacterales bacterium]
MTDLHMLNARRDQLITDLCQIHLDELGAERAGDDAAAAEAGELMTAIEAEIAEINAAIAQREEERARVEADRGPFTWSHPDINPRHRPTAPEQERHATAAERALDAAWIDHCAARNDYNSLPHNASEWMRRRDRARMERTLDAVKRAEERNS